MRRSPLSPLRPGRASGAVRRGLALKAGLGLALATGLAGAAQAAPVPQGPASAADAGAASAAGATALPVTLRSAQQALPARSTQSLAQAVAADALAQSAETRTVAPAQAAARLAAAQRELVVDVRSATAGWARGVAYIEAPKTEHAAPQGWLFVARQVGGRWVTGLEGDQEFAGFVATSPLVPVAERASLKAFAEKKASATNGTLAATGLLLPWMPDYYMTMSGGPHAWDGGSGPWSSLDFAGGNASGIVRSSGSGTATSMCGAGGGWTRVIHPNGFSTDYYHMHSTTYYNGTAVGRSAYLGVIGVDVCAGGAASGAHVHWGLRTYDAAMNGQYTNLHGRGIGGWTFYHGTAQYGGYAVRNGVTAYPGHAIYNRLS
ncbi:Peptidase M23 [Kribbella flavida DSM 17836]|uniref:Peptidase M23 n=1 Tax=Kribbella flavida (strain DSM 17836 / JCM 10339 / NBRC 14399) TaxID=479435 RepID=D2PR33_KRIFD|nr:M23 family metallopeptidase [Kribbella flavida]ADB32981.1 Peptidase M23 [Kribbella flavida DSM 17836]